MLHTIPTLPRILMEEEPECGWETRWYSMNVDASLHLGHAMVALRRFGVVEQVVGGPGTIPKAPPDLMKWPGPLKGWPSGLCCEQAQGSSKTTSGGVEYDLEEVEKLAKRAIDRWGRRMLVEVERLWKVVRGRKDRRRGGQ